MSTLYVDEACLPERAHAVRMRMHEREGCVCEPK